MILKHVHHLKDTLQLPTSCPRPTQPLTHFLSTGTSLSASLHPAMDTWASAFLLLWITVLYTSFCVDVCSVFFSLNLGVAAIISHWTWQDVSPAVDEDSNSSPYSQTLGIARLVKPSLQWRRSRIELWLSLLNGGVEYFCFLAIFPSLKYSRIFSMSVMCQVLRGADLKQNTRSYTTRMPFYLLLAFLRAVGSSCPCLYLLRAMITPMCHDAQVSTVFYMIYV